MDNTVVSLQSYAINCEQVLVEKADVITWSWRRCGGRSCCLFSDTWFYVYYWKNDLFIWNKKDRKYAFLNHV